MKAPETLEPEDPFALRRAQLVQQLRREGIHHEPVLGAIGRVERHRLVPQEHWPLAYENRPLPIGLEQTISQPYVVAFMSQLARVQPGDRVLEVGTGSGYQAAVLAELGANVFSVEILEPLALRARAALEALGYGDRVSLRVGDGYAGWPEAAPFDAVLVTAAPAVIPQPLLDQLAVGGRLVAPVGRGTQQLVVATRESDRVAVEQSLPVRFVPMTGRAQTGG